MLNFSRTKFHPLKLKTFKNDLAPIGFFFDVFGTEFAKIPVMPVPMRIDRVTNGLSTFIILPDESNLNKTFQKYGLQVDFKSFLLEGLRNLIHFAKRKKKEITLLSLEQETIEKWYKSSLLIETELPSLTRDFTWILGEFLKTYSSLMTKEIEIPNDECRSQLILCCDTIVNYLNTRLMENDVEIADDNSNQHTKIYFKKKKKYFPQIISITIRNKATQKLEQMRFVPYLIYDDLIACYSYNKILLQNKTQEIFNLKLWNERGIIIKNVKLPSLGPNGDLAKIGLQNIKLGELLT